MIPTRALVAAATLLAATLSFAQGDFSASLSLPQGAAPGAKISGTVTIDIPPGLHAYANPSGDPNLIELTISASKPAGASVSARYPTGVQKSFDGLTDGPVGVYEGSVKIPITVTLPAGSQGSVAVEIKVKAQLCDDSVCYPPKTKVLSAAVAVGSSAAPPAGVVIGTTSGDDKVSWRATLEPAAPQPGQDAEIVLTGRISSGWQIYAVGAGSRIELQGSPSVSATGKPKLPGSRSVPDLGAAPPRNVRVYSGTVVFRIPVTIATDATGPQTASVRVTWSGFGKDKRMATTSKLVEADFTLPGPAVELPPSLPPTSGDSNTLAAGTTDSPTSAATVSEQQDDLKAAKSRGLWAYILLAFFAGIAALGTPCVFPMIPITVSFFSKKNENPGQAKWKGPLAYVLGIMATYTALGILVAVVFGATGLTKVSQNPIINVALALLFVVLAMSLFGVFEIRLPSALVNSVGGKSRVGGVLGPVLMGVTFTLTSFTCTVPFVASILAGAAGGDVGTSVVGMLAFSAAFAAPFFFLALFPNWLNSLPRAGAWMVTLKAFMGFLELAFALKFLSNADLVWGLGILTREVFLAAWAVIFVLAAVYLFGWFIFPKETATPVGWARRSVGLVMAALAVGSFYGINKSFPQKDLEAFVPPDPYPYKLTTVSRGANAEGINWIEDYQVALAKAQAEGKPLFLDFTGVTCINCRWMEKNIFPTRSVVAELEQMVTVKLWTDRGTPGDEFNARLLEKLSNQAALPTYVILSPDGKVLKISGGLTRDAGDFVDFIRSGRTTVASR
jgi:thiol:disulfide interchange protein DsbD